MQGLVIVLLSLARFALGAKEYSVSNTQANWHGARDYCTSQGMQLASVESLTDHQALTESIRSSNGFIQDSVQRFWLGGNDLQRKGHWTWVGSGLPMVYTNWFTGEPNKEIDSEECVEIIHNVHSKAKWGWNDVDCRYKRYFVCQTVNETAQSRYESLQKPHETLQQKYEVLKKHYETELNQSKTTQRKFENLQKQHECLQSQWETAQNQSETVQKKYEELQRQFELLQSQYETAKMQCKTVEVQHGQVPCRIICPSGK